MTAKEPTAGTQAAAILEYLRHPNFGLTPTKALELFGCFRLAARINDLRRLGWDIKAQPFKVPSGKTVARYYLD